MAQERTLLGMTQFAESDGARIAYDVSGSGPDVVLIHAGVTDRRMWDAVVPLLASDHRVTRYDMRGFGETVEDEKGAWAPRRDLLAVMDAAGIEAACIVGVSMGGGAAINFTLEHPERVSHLVPVNPGVGGFDYQPDEWETDIDGRISAAWKDKRLDECADLEIEMWLAGPHRGVEDLDPALVARMREWLEVSYTKAPEWSAAEPMDPPAAQRLGEIAAPTLAVLGELDVASMHGVIDAIAAGVPGAAKVVMAGTAHLPPYEDPAGFADVLRRFVGG
jgi:pimeloyl-ACP methyl ester carboxylesterase